MDVTDVLVPLGDRLGYKTSIADFFSRFRSNQIIHPVGDRPVPIQSEFFTVDSLRKLRVIHLLPHTAPANITAPHHHNSQSCSLNEEYWFTRWNKPLKYTGCNCSFRRSKRYSSHRFSVKIGDVRMSEIIDEQPPLPTVQSTSAIVLDKYVEHFVQSTMTEAFNEYTKNIKTERSPVKLEQATLKGVDNLAYVQTGDEVVIRVVKNSCERHTNGHKTVKTKATIILLHGIGSGADVWGAVADRLVAHGYEVIAPDMLGHGYSSSPNRPKYYTFKSLLWNTLQLFDHYASMTTTADGISRQRDSFILIGHSFGCSLASGVARCRPHHVTQLVLISGGGPTPLCSPAPSTELTIFGCAMQTIVAPLLFCGVKRSLFYAPRGKHFVACPQESDGGVSESTTVLEDNGNKTTEKQHSKENVDVEKTTTIKKTDVTPVDPVKMPQSYVLEYISSGQNWPEGDAAFHRRILVPTLLVHGLKDDRVTLVQECEMERTIPRAFLELLPNVGHMSMVESPDKLCHMILCFLDWWSK